MTHDYIRLSMDKRIVFLIANRHLLGHSSIAYRSIAVYYLLVSSGLYLFGDSFVLGWSPCNMTLELIEHPEIAP